MIVSEAVWRAMAAGLAAACGIMALAAWPRRGESPRTSADGAHAQPQPWRAPSMRRLSVVIGACAAAMAAAQAGTGAVSTAALAWGAALALAGGTRAPDSGRWAWLALAAAVPWLLAAALDGGGPQGQPFAAALPAACATLAAIAVIATALPALCLAQLPWRLIAAVLLLLAPTHGPAWLHGATAEVPLPHGGLALASGSYLPSSEWLSAEAAFAWTGAPWAALVAAALLVAERRLLAAAAAILSLSMAWFAGIATGMAPEADARAPLVTAGSALIIDVARGSAGPAAVWSGQVALAWLLLAQDKRGDTGSTPGHWSWAAAAGVAALTSLAMGAAGRFGATWVVDAGSGPLWVLTIASLTMWTWTTSEHRRHGVATAATAIAALAAALGVGGNIGWRVASLWWR